MKSFNDLAHRDQKIHKGLKSQLNAALKQTGFRFVNQKSKSYVFEYWSFIMFPIVKGFTCWPCLLCFFNNKVNDHVEPAFSSTWRGWTWEGLIDVRDMTWDKLSLPFRMISPDFMHVVDHGVLLEILQKCIMALSPGEYLIFVGRVSKYWVCKIIMQSYELFY